MTIRKVTWVNGPLYEAYKKRVRELGRTIKWADEAMMRYFIDKTEGIKEDGK